MTVVETKMIRNGLSLKSQAS